MSKLKYKELKELRDQLLLENNHICPLCNTPIDPKSTNGPVLDHSHTSGKIRNTVHRFCNTFISKIENNRKRNLINEDMLTAILANYEQYISNERIEEHPLHTKVKRKPKKQKPVLRIVK